MKMVRVGYLPLTDALPLLYARQKGFDEQQGIHLNLVSMASWAQLRDALLTGQIDAAHCLPGIPLATQAGIYGAVPRLATAFTLNHSGNTITVRADLVDHTQPRPQLLSSAFSRRPPERPLTFASVFPVSKHNFEMRYWLHTQGIRTDDVQLQVLPPPSLAAALSAERIDGFCAGEPWGSVAQRLGAGQIMSHSRTLGLPATEKVLAVREEWLDSAEHCALLRCLHASCHELDTMRNRQRGAVLLADTLGLGIADIRPALFNEGVFASAGTGEHFLSFAGVNRPDRRHGVWLLVQMFNERGDDLRPAMDSPADIGQRTFRSDIYDAVLGTHN
ncbi:MAG: ABC transporter substrate-binding protein [Oceanococcaceae bacterium]